MRVAQVITDEKIVQALKRVKDYPKKTKRLLDICFEEALRLELEQAKKEKDE